MKSIEIKCLIKDDQGIERRKMHTSSNPTGTEPGSVNVVLRSEIEAIAMNPLKIRMYKVPSPDDVERALMQTR
jgi:hypothetical protein